MRKLKIVTFGCQANELDSARIAGLLARDGYRLTDEDSEADLIILNGCSIRDKAEQKLFSRLGTLQSLKARQPGLRLGVAGCLGQREGEALLRRFPYLDLVVGNGEHLAEIPRLLRIADVRPSSATSEPTGLFPANVDVHRDSRFRAWVGIMEGCDNFCSFCVVPHTRGRERSRPLDEILREVADLRARGYREITLLGQTVNAYGRHDLRRGGAAGTVGFAALLAQLDALPGLARIRYTSPHPSFFDDALIRAHAELPALCPHVHLPLQSGSDPVLARMRRRYRADEYRRLVERLRAARPDLALTTDLIVGFPGETDADFEATLALVRDVGFVDAYTFKYSPRPGTAAARAEDPLPARVLEERLEALQQLLRGLTLDAHRRRVGEITEVLVEGPSRRGGLQGTGRDPYHRVVNFAVTGEAGPAAGELLRLRIVEATPHSLIGERLADAHEGLGSLTGAPGKADERSWSAVSGP